MTVHYVPAGGELYSEHRRQLFIGNTFHENEQSFHGKLFKRWHTHTKTITLTSSTNLASVCTKDATDICIPIQSPQFLKNCELTKVLVNPINGLFQRPPFAALGIEAIVDSGGFQLLKGTTDYVDLDKLAASYNENADIGMPLDLPVTTVLEPVFFDAVSKLIKANDEYLLKRLDKRVDLALISHGSTLARRKARLDILDRKANVVAIAGLGAKIPGADRLARALENMMYVVHRYHKTARYFHILGVTSKFWLFVYALLDATKYVKSIGADSVTHRMSALVGDYDTPDFGVISLKRTAYKQTPYCPCPICFAIEDTRILNNTSILEAHNLWVRAKNTELCCELAAHYVAGDIKLEVVAKKLDIKDTTEFTKLIDYVMRIVASDKFKPYANVSTKTSLFKARPVTHAKKELYTKVIKTYEKIHKKRFL